MIGQLIDFAGWLGAASLLLGYALASAGRLSGRSAGFQALNLVGAVGLLVNGTWHGAWPSAALNAVWLVIGITALCRNALASDRVVPSKAGQRSAPVARVQSAPPTAAAAGAAAVTLAARRASRRRR